VSGKGVVELQAQLYRTQEQARMRGDGIPGVQDKHIRRKAGQQPGACSAHQSGGPSTRVLGPSAVVRGYNNNSAQQHIYVMCQFEIHVLGATLARGVHISSCMLHQQAALPTHSPSHPAASPPSPQPPGIDVSSIKNKGVEAREARDRAAAAKASGTGPERLAESSAALARKAALYDRLAAQGGAGDDQQDDKYEVGRSTNHTGCAAAECVVQSLESAADVAAELVHLQERLRCSWCRLHLVLWALWTHLQQRCFLWVLESIRIEPRPTARVCLPLPGCTTTYPCAVPVLLLCPQVEFWRKGAAHDEEQWQQQRHEQEWLQGRGPVDSAHAAVGGSGDMMTEDMARWGVVHKRQILSDHLV
jgi:hypothetical protein